MVFTSGTFACNRETILKEKVVSQKMFAISAPRITLLVLLIMVAPLQPTSADEAIWIEGEGFANSTFNQHSWYQNDGVNKDLLSPGVPGDANGEWHVHYISSSGGPSTAAANYSFNVSEGGTYKFWIRLNPYLDAYSYRFDGAPYQHLDVTDSADSFNVLTEPRIDTRFLGWVYVGEFDFTAGPHAVSIQLSADSRCRGGIDVIALVNFSWAPTGAIPPNLNPPAPEPNDWFMLSIGPDEYSNDSIIDVCDLLDKPAGVHGVLTRNGPDFEFADETPVKFWGIGGVMAESEHRQLLRARFWAKHGINMVRQHTVEDVLGSLQGPLGARYFNPGKLDKLDKWFAILKEHGIYMTWSIFYHFVVLPDQVVSQGGNIPDELYDELPDRGAGKDVYGLMCLVEEYQDAEWEYVNLLLNHVNPYTGLAYKDDPALAVIECRNEDSIFFHNPLNDLKNDVRPNHSARLRDLWQDWVLDKYGSDANLIAAWGAGIRAGDSVYNESMYVYAAYHMYATGPANPAEMQRMGDYIRFLAEMQRDTYETYQSRLRSIGFEGITVSTAWWAEPGANAANLWTDDAMDAIDRHNYFGGGEVNWKIVPGQVNNGTHLAQPGTGILDRGFWQIEDKPFMMTEYTQKPPNQWKAELSPLWAFYGMGLQGWDASYKFTASRSYMGNGWPGMSTYTLATPHYIGQFPALAFAIYNNHISEGDITAARRLSEDQIFQGFDALTQDFAGGGYDPCAPVGNLQTPPETFAIGRVTAKFADGLEHSEKQDWSQYWDDVNDIVQSNTGQLTWDYGNKVVTVHSDKTQAVVGFAGGGTYDLPGVVVEVDTNFVSMLFTPLDNQPLIDSEHILITAMAQDKQYNAVYNSDGTQLLFAGGEPLMLEPVKATIVFKGNPLKTVKVVDVYGVPTEQLVERDGNTFTIDGRYATYYYEVKRFVPVDCNAANLDDTGTVNFGDYAIMAADWNTSGTGDIDGSGTVDIDDMMQIAFWWLNDCSRP